MGTHRYLGQLEQMTLLAVLRLGDAAYGRAIREELATRTGRRFSHGAAYITLERLEAKGYLSSAMGESTARRGGRPKRYYQVTPEGARALHEARKALDSLWDGVGDVLEDLG